VVLEEPIRSASVVASIWDLISAGSSTLMTYGSSALGAGAAGGGGGTASSTPRAGGVSVPSSPSAPLSRTSSGRPDKGPAGAASKVDAWLAAREQEMESHYQVALEYLPPLLESLTLEGADIRPLPPAPAAGASAGGALSPKAAAGKAGRPVLPQLTHLALDSCKVTDAGLRDLLGRLGQLRSLELAELQGVTDEGVQAVGAVAQLQQLVVCQLEAGGVTAASLRAACCCPRLAVLAWATTDLATSLGGEALVACLRRPARLQKLMLYTADEGVRETGGPLRRAFEWALPLVSITYGPMHA
jgi:hypothetical protein